MSAEFYIRFADPNWLIRNRDRLVERLRHLSTFVRADGTEVWLRDPARTVNVGDWEYDVRLLLDGESSVMLEISAHPLAIEADLKSTMTWLRAEVAVEVVDDDGVPSRW